MKHKEPMFYWDPENHIATCILESEGKTYCGIAACHPDDFDFESEKVGCNIAYSRAVIQVMQDRIANNLKPRYAGLHQLYYSMNRSKYFDPESYPIRRLVKQMEDIEDEISALKESVKTLKDETRKYIADKEAFYQKIRKSRSV